MLNARLMKLALLFALLAPASFVAQAQKVVPLTESGEAPLTNSSVVKLVRAGFREKTVITIINARPVRFDLTPDRLIELKKSGVSEKIILAMLARDEGGVLTGDDWETDDGFFKQGNSRRGASGGDGDAAQDGTDIFGSSSGSRNRSRTETGRGGGTGDTQTNGSATVRILRPPTETGSAPPKLERTPTLTNDAIVELVEAGFSEGTIIRRIEQSPVEFDLTTPKLTELRRRRVPEPVINAMKNAMADDGAQPEK